MAHLRQRVSVHLIETQRLLRFQPGPRKWEHRRLPNAYVETVKSYAQDLQTRISTTLTAYAKQSQSLDQTFPQRLLQSAVTPLSVEELTQRMQELEGKREQLKRIGLIDEEPVYPFDVKALEKLEDTRRTVSFRQAFVERGKRSGQAGFSEAVALRHPVMPVANGLGG